jgi:hypothetical protein
MTDVLYIDNTGIVEVQNLRDVDGAFINDATVTLEDITAVVGGASVTGITYPLAMAYVTGSDGKYRALVPDDAGLTAGESYVAGVKAVKSGQVGRWNRDFIARTRADR